MVEATTAAMIVMRDAAGASSEQLRRLTVVADTVTIQIEKAFDDPTSAKVSAIARVDAMAEACVSITRRTAQGAVAAERENRSGVTVKKTASSSMHNLCTCARADAAA
eukprot:2735793-Pleurochrysis_carterae.AAC.1